MEIPPLVFPEQPRSNGISIKEIEAVAPKMNAEASIEAIEIVEGEATKKEKDSEDHCEDTIEK